MRQPHIIIWMLLFSLSGATPTLAVCKSENSPRVSHLLHKTGQLLETQGAQAAANMLEQTLQQDTVPADYRLFVRLAELHQQNTHPRQAVAAYEHALRLCDEHAWLWQNLGSLCWDMKMYRRAAEAFLNAYECGADTSIYYAGIIALSYAGQLDVAAQKLQALIEREAEAPITWVEGYAQICLQAKKARPALDAICAWEQRYQEHFSYWRVRAFLHIESAEYCAAVAALRIADNIQTLAPQERSTLAELLLQIELPHQAAQQYAHLLEQDKTNPQWQRQYIISLRLADLPDKALIALEQAQATLPPEFYLRQHGELHYETQNYAAAFQSFANLLKIDPEDASTHLLQGYCAFNLGKHRTAKKHLRKASASEPQRKAAASMLQWLEQTQGR